jgi:hypothetical protein
LNDENVRRAEKPFDVGDKLQVRRDLFGDPFNTQAVSVKFCPKELEAESEM